MPNTKNPKSRLAQYLAQHAGHDSFPDQHQDYFTRFVAINEFLNDKVHPAANVGPGAREPIWLTDHGPNHVAHVIDRASDLLFSPGCALTPYEAYILLLAIHFHDVGNIFGRDEHERRILEQLFVPEVVALLGPDAAERRMVGHIAQAHGGYADLAREDKDTIGKLKYDRPRHLGRGSVRVKTLAAILRFADELADDHTRTNRFVQAAVAELQPGSEVYHIYADRLRRVEVDLDSRTIRLHFEVNPEVISRTHGKHDDGVEFIDEVFSRTFKVYQECLYCSRFMIPYVLLEQIHVVIDVCSGDYSQVLGKLEYIMAQDGYPSIPADIRLVCPVLAGVNGDWLRAQVADLSPPPVPDGYGEPRDLLSLLRTGTSPIEPTRDPGARRSGLAAFFGRFIGG
jgi:hypothetical protein